MEEGKAITHMAPDWHERTTAQQLDIIARGNPDALIVYEGGKWWTAGVLVNHGRALAQSLNAMGLIEGDVISTQMPNWAEAIAIDYAAATLGLVINPIALIYRQAELRQILEDCKAKAIFVPAAFGHHDYLAMSTDLQADLPDLQHVIVLRDEGPLAYDELIASGDRDFQPGNSVSPDAVKMVMYTSGTTGRAKGVLHSHRTLGICVRNTAAICEVTPTDRALVLGPVGHLGGYLYAVMFPIITGAPSAMLERWNADAAARLIDELGLTYATGATTFLQDLLGVSRQTGRALSSLRLFVCGGASVPPKVIEDFVAAAPGRIAFRCFGMTEAPNVSQRRPGPFDLRTASTTDGYPIGYEIRAVDDEGTVLPPGKEGEIRLRGPGLMLGYKRAEDNAAAFDDAGYFRTGDMGYIDAEGYLVISGRIKDLIIRGGENISAKEIEDVVQVRPGIERVAIVGVPDPDSRLGETIYAFAIPDRDARPDLSDLNTAILAAGLAKQKQISKLYLVSEFPLTPFGKIRKNVLRGDPEGWYRKYGLAST